MSKAGLPVNKPISTWNKPLKADWKALFKALAKGAKDGVLGKWEDLPGAGVDLLTSIGLETSAEERAYLLIRRALTAAIHELVGEAVPQFQLVQGDEVALVERFDWSLEESELRIDPRFFDRPADLTIVENLTLPLQELLVMFTVDRNRARAISNRLGTYFTFHLAQEWRQNPSAYAPLRNALEGPFAEAAEREQGWILYHAWLQKQVAAPAFGESFGLEELYTSLRGYWDKEAATYEGPLGPEGDGVVEAHRSAKPVRLRVAGDLHQEIESWLDDPHPPCMVRLITGDPGSGKSTLARALAAKVSEKRDRPVLHVPLLHLNDVEAGFKACIARFIEGDLFLTTNPLDPQQGERRLLVILDGLDELGSRRLSTSKFRSAFLTDMQDTVARLNSQGRDIRILITGRPTDVDAELAGFSKPGKVLRLLPYQIPSTELAGKFSNAGDEDVYKLLKEDQRQDWWRRFGNCVAKPYTGVPRELDRPDLADILRHPLWNYLVALAYDRGRIDFTRNTSLNEVYFDILNALFERRWGSIGSNPNLSGLHRSHFGVLLEEIATCAWHGNWNSISTTRVAQRFRALGLVSVAQRLADDPEEAARRLLMVFYFERTGFSETGEPTFDFTHRTLGEYLVSRKLVRTMETIHQRFKEREGDPSAGWAEPRALQEWITLAGPVALDPSILRFLRQEVALRTRTQVHSVQQSFARLLSHELRAALPVQDVNPSLSLSAAVEWNRNSEETLLAALNACARVTRNRSQIDWPLPTSFGDLVGRLRKQRSDADGPSSLGLDCTGFLELQGRHLYLIDLFKADLEDSVLAASLGVLGVFRGASLQRTDLQRADLRRATFEDANFENADLRGAMLDFANIQRGQLRNADLESAQLGYADLTGAQLEGANLRSANLGSANLQGADLHNAQLQRANLQRANLSGAYLARADLRKADLRRANLRSANLRGADLRGADLREANLDAADLRGTNSDMAELGGEGPGRAKLPLKQVTNR